MTDIETINAFFARESLDGNEQILKQKCIELKRQIDALSDELKSGRQELLKKEEEVKAATNKFDVLLQLALEQEKSRLASLSVEG